jgi:hypothetical protein
VACDENDPVADQLAGECDRLIGIAGVVTHDQLDALAEHPALGVEIFDRQLGAALVLLAEPRIGPGHVAGDADADLGLRGLSRKASDQDHADSEQSGSDHGDPPSREQHSALRPDWRQSESRTLSAGFR